MSNAADGLGESIPPRPVSIFKKYFWPVVCGVLAAVFHLQVVVRVVVSSGGIGENQAFTVLFFDFPLVFLLDLLPHGVIYAMLSPLEPLGSYGSYLFVVAVIGTLMYALFGFGIGLVIRRMFRR